MNDTYYLRNGLNRVRRGWTQGKLRRSTIRGPEYCLLGSVDRDDEAVDAIAQVLGIRGRFWRSIRIARWNDNSERTRSEVIKVLEQALAIKEGAVATGNPLIDTLDLRRTPRLVPRLAKDLA